MKVESYGFDIEKESYFISQCDRCEGTAITVMINSAFEAELKFRARQEEIKKEQEEKAIAEAETKAKEESNPEQKKEPEPKEKILAGRVRFTFKQSNLEKIRYHMSQIKALCETWENE